MAALRFLSAICLIFACGFVASAEEKAKSEPAKAEKPDAERIVGTWFVETSEPKSELLQNDKQKMRLKFDDGKFEFAVLQDDSAIINIPGNYALDDKQTPKLLDITLTADGATPVFAIYEFQGEKLRICHRTGGAGQRPAGFEAPAAECTIVTLVREAVAK
jgi:uncharacterized protein (TIGR03067 family)